MQNALGAPPRPDQNMVPNPGPMGHPGDMPQFMHNVELYSEHLNIGQGLEVAIWEV